LASSVGTNLAVPQDTFEDVVQGQDIDGQYDVTVFVDCLQALIETVHCRELFIHHVLLEEVVDGSQLHQHLLSVLLWGVWCGFLLVHHCSLELCLDQEDVGLVDVLRQSEKRTSLIAFLLVTVKCEHALEDNANAQHNSTKHNQEAEK